MFFNFSLLTTVAAVDLKCKTSDYTYICDLELITSGPSNSYKSNEINFIAIPIKQFSAVEIVQLLYTPNFATHDLPKKIFTTFPKLSISSDDFNSAGKLEVLELSSNNLEKISARLFTALSHLLELNFYNNKIHQIEDFAFDGLANVRDLYLLVNRLTKIRRATFAGLRSLTMLNLNDNAIAEIEVGAFEFLPKLQMLYLARNKLEMPADYFFGTLLQPLNDLIILNFNSNKIHGVSLKVFAKQFANLAIASLEYIDYDLDSDVVSGDEISASKSKLSSIALSGNKMRSGKIFQKLKLFPNLKYAYLKNCSLATSHPKWWFLQAFIYLRGSE